jgi:hypothetical protein
MAITPSAAKCIENTASAADTLIRNKLNPREGFNSSECVQRVFHKRLSKPYLASLFLVGITRELISKGHSDLVDQILAALAAAGKLKP